MRNESLSNVRQFTLKNAESGRLICISLKIYNIEKKCGVRQIITVICVTYVQQNFKIRTYI